MLERIYDVLIVLAIFGFALGRVRRSDATLGPALSWVFATGGWFVGALSMVVLGLLAVFRHFSESIRRRLLQALAALPERHFKKVDRGITAFVQGMESTRSQKAMLTVVCYTVLEWATIASTVFCVMRAFGGALHFGWLDVLIFLGFLAFGAVVQIPGVGGGTQVISVVVLTELFPRPSGGFHKRGVSAMVYFICSSCAVGRGSGAARRHSLAHSEAVGTRGYV